MAEEKQDNPSSSVDQLIKNEVEKPIERKSKEEKIKMPKQPYCLATSGPGPAYYKLPSCLGHKDHDPSRWRSPAFTVLGRGSLTCGDDSDIPGPKYDVRNCTRYGVITSPSVKFKEGRGSATVKKSEPPGNMLGYQEEKRKPLPHELRGFSIAGRHYLSSKGFTPAPNLYKIPGSLGSTVPDLKNAPAFSIRSRPYMRQKERAPGPTDYIAVNCNLYKTQAPRATVATKIPSKIESDVPGPTAYKVNFKWQLPRAPTAAFGLKHSMCAGTMRTPVDDSLNNG